MESGKRIQEDVRIPTQCGRCYAQCAVNVRRVNGVAVKIDGEPNSTLGSEGGLCGKGSSGLQVLYDPNRLNKPLRRTNPEKGLHVDPKWKEISCSTQILSFSVAAPEVTPLRLPQPISG